MDTAHKLDVRARGRWSRLSTKTAPTRIIVRISRPAVWAA